MKTTFAATLFATALGFAPAVWAEPGLRFAAADVGQPKTVQPAAHAGYLSYYAQEPTPAASERAVAAPDALAPPPTASACGCNSCGDGNACGGCATGCGGCDCCCGGLQGLGCCNLGEPWRLFPQHPCGPNIGGWVSGGIYDNAYGSPSNAPVAFRQIAEEFTLNQAWFYAERVADGEGGLDWGYRVDYIFGTDGPDTQAFGQASGYDTDWDTSSRYGSALPQLYGQVAYGDLSVKFGHFFTIIGYEVVPAPDNFFTSYAYTMNYGEPFTHTGALAEYAMTDDVTLYGGYTFGWDTGFDDGGDGSTFLGGVGLQLTEDVTFAWTTSFGDLNPLAGGGDVFLSSAVLIAQLTERWNYVIQSDYADNRQANGNHAYWYGVNQYLFYKFNDCWSYGTRFEWFDDEDGVRVGYGDADYFEVTTGLNWRPHANVVIRPEIRYDWVDGGATPFNDGTESDQLAGGFDFIFTY